MNWDLWSICNKFLRKKKIKLKKIPFPNQTTKLNFGNLRMYFTKFSESSHKWKFSPVKWSLIKGPNVVKMQPLHVRILDKRNDTLINVEGFKPFYDQIPFKNCSHILTDVIIFCKRKYVRCVCWRAAFQSLGEIFWPTTEQH